MSLGLHGLCRDEAKALVWLLSAAAAHIFDAQKRLTPMLALNPNPAVLAVFCETA